MKQKPSAGTIARLICIILTAVNQVVYLKTGKSLLPFESSELEPWITTGLTLAASAWAYWKNNSWTPEAIAADHEMHAKKQSKSKGEWL